MRQIIRLGSASRGLSIQESRRSLLAAPPRRLVVREDEGRALLIRPAPRLLTRGTQERALLSQAPRRLILREGGRQGGPGLSAYQLALANGFSGTEQQWLDSLNSQSAAWASVNW